MQYDITDFKNQSFLCITNFKFYHLQLFWENVCILMGRTMVALEIMTLIIKIIAVRHHAGSPINITNVLLRTCLPLLSLL